MDNVNHRNLIKFTPNNYKQILQYLEKWNESKKKSKVVRQAQRTKRHRLRKSTDLHKISNPLAGIERSECSVCDRLKCNGLVHNTVTPYIYPICNRCGDHLSELQELITTRSKRNKISCEICYHTYENYNEQHSHLLAHFYRTFEWCQSEFHCFDCADIGERNNMLLNKKTYILVHQTTNSNQYYVNDDDDGNDEHMNVMQSRDIQDYLIGNTNELSSQKNLLNETNIEKKIKRPKLFRTKSSVEDEEETSSSSSSDLDYDDILNEHMEKLVLLGFENRMKQLKNLRCTICYIDFFTIDEQIQHFRRIHSHTVDDSISYTCPYCTKEFPTKLLTRQHIQELHINMETDLFHCNQCSKKFDTPFSILEHSIHHKRKSEYLCEYCASSFKLYRNLEIHQHIHFKRLKRYICEMCPAAYLHPGGLIYHKSTHTGEKRYQCIYCKKRYRDASDLRRHKRIHVVTEKKCICPLCDQRFYENYNLKCHMKKVHYK